MNSNHGSVVFYEAAGIPAVEVRLDRDTVWVTQKQMALLLDTEHSVVTKHIRNIIKTAELQEVEVCAKNAHTAADGKTYETTFYNLDMIISVGYRVNSKRGVQFRQWATRVLREHLVRGYTVNERRLAELRKTVRTTVCAGRWPPFFRRSAARKCTQRWRQRRQAFFIS